MLCQLKINKNTKTKITEVIHGTFEPTLGGSLPFVNIENLPSNPQGTSKTSITYKICDATVKQQKQNAIPRFPYIVIQVHNFSSISVIFKVFI